MSPSQALLAALLVAIRLGLLASLVFAILAWVVFA